MQKFLLEKKFF
jgi:hypothetical protein